MRKILLAFGVSAVLLLTGCNSIKATIGEYIDAYSDYTPRTVFYFDIPAEIPYEKDTGWLIKNDRGISEILCDKLTGAQIQKYLTDGYIRKKSLSCQIAILYRRSGELIWPGEYRLVWEKVGGDIFYAERWTPEYKAHPTVSREEICLISPEKNDEIMIFVEGTAGEIRFLVRKFSELPDFTGEHYHRIGIWGFYDCILDRGPFFGPFGSRFPHKVIKFPLWDKLTPLNGDDLKYYQNKLFSE